MFVPSLKTAFAIGSCAVMIACTEPQLVDPSVAQRFAVQSTSVDVPDALQERATLRDTSYLGNFVAATQASVAGQGAVADQPVVVTIALTDMVVSPSRGSSASGQYTVTDATTGAVVFGPQAFSAITPDPADSAVATGGLVGIMVSAAIAGMSEASPRAFQNEVEELGQFVGRKVKSQIFGSN